LCRIRGLQNVKIIYIWFKKILWCFHVKYVQFMCIKHEHGIRAIFVWTYENQILHKICTSLWNIVSLWCYISERRITSAKTYGIKMKCYGKHVSKHIENLGNIFATWWEPIRSLNGIGEKWQKIFFPPLPPNLKGKIYIYTLSACLGLPIGCMKFLFQKTFVTILA
jgi:hypothetical protein